MTYLIYLFQASLILASFYFFYRWLIRPLTFYGFKRILLLSIPVLALGMPLLEFDLGWQAPVSQLIWQSKEWPASETIATPVETPGNEVNTKPAPVSYQSSSWHWSQWTLALYFFGMGITAVFLGYKLFLVIRMHQKSTHWRHNIYLSTEAKPAYSFASKVYLHPELIISPDISHILAHEQVHVKQWHTLDIILFELLASTFWFNPVTWLLARESRLNNEMLADKVSAADSKTEYAQLLLKYAAANSRHLSYSFARLQVKSRIEGVLGDESKSSSKIRFAIVVPIILSGLFVFSCSQELIYPEKLSYFNGKKIKRIEAIYFDEYGDQPQRDGKSLKFMDFNRNGNVKDFGSTESIYNLPEATDLTSAVGFVENSPFDPILTHGFLQEGYEFIKTYIDRIEQDQTVYLTELQPMMNNKKRNRTVNVKWSDGYPTELRESYNREFIMIIRNKKDPKTSEIINTGEMVKRKVLEKFEYDFDLRTIKHYQAKFKHEKSFFYFDTEGNKPLTERDEYPEEPQFDYFESHTYQFDEQDRLIAIFRNDGSLLKEIEYLNEKLISLYRVYNMKEELEYTVKVNYEFY
ncbi:MAG: M56 family metallopeptidase [Cyclobacteriaceae bacterium]